MKELTDVGRIHMNLKRGSYQFSLSNILQKLSLNRYSVDLYLASMCSGMVQRMTFLVEITELLVDSRTYPS